MVTNETDDLPNLAVPARSALIAAGYNRLEKLAHVPESSVARLHGVGPAAIRTLRAALNARGLAFAPDASDLDIDLAFALDIEISTRITPYMLDEAPYEEMQVTARLNLEAVEMDPEVLTSAGLPLELGHGQRTLVRLHCGENLVLALDDRDQDSLDLASHLFQGDQLQPRLEEMCQGFAGSVLLMDHFALDPNWRGLGLGPLISLATMRTLALGRDISCAALHAAPPLPADHDLSSQERGQIARKIRNAWKRCGFQVLDKTDEGWIMVAPGVAEFVWPSELWPALLNEVNSAVNDYVAKRISMRSS
ncbi:hypothetical protein ACWDRB_60775 [Nonomuraea sp. NPDC003707]